MARNRITKEKIDDLGCSSGQDRAFLWDGETRGFGVVAFKSGKKVFVAQYRLNGRSHRVNIGTYGTMLLDDTKAPDGKPIFGARTLARDILNAARKGDDPMKARRDAAAVRTFKEVAEQFLRDHAEAKRKPQTAEGYRRLLENHVYPAIGSQPVTDIRRDQVMRLHRDMKGKPYAANRCLSVISSLWNWAAESGEVNPQDNPAKLKRSRRYREQGKERFLSAAELGKLGDALRRAETDGLPWIVDETKPTAKHAPKENRIRLIDRHAVAAIRLLILTGARLREILHAKWDYVDFDRGIIFLPDSKTGKKPIYLSAAALAVLNDIPRIKENPYLIPGEKRPRKRGEPKPEPSPRADLKRPWEAVARAAGFFETLTEKDANGKPVTVERSTVRLHDLRHSFASMGAGASLGLPIIGKLLGHTQAATTARYSHLDADPMRRAADIIGGQIAAAMSGKSGDVIDLNEQRKAR